MIIFWLFVNSLQIENIQHAKFAVSSLHTMLKYWMLLEVDFVVNTLCKRMLPFSSVLSENRAISFEVEDTLLESIIKELHTR